MQGEVRAVMGEREREQMRGRREERREGGRAGRRKNRGRVRESRRVHSTCARQRISYLKFSRSAPHKPLHAANEDASGRTSAPKNPRTRHLFFLF